MTGKEIKEFYDWPADELLILFICKWMFRGFVAWILSAIIFKFTLMEFIIALGVMLGFNTWMIRGEWRKYKQWLIIKGRKDKWKHSSK